MNMRGSAGGFTLIEMVVTVAIVALLASMAMPLTHLIVKRAREQELRADLRDIRDALDRYNELWRLSCQVQPAGAAGNGSAGPAAGGNPVNGINGANAVNNAAGQNGGATNPRGAGGNSGGNSFSGSAAFGGNGQSGAGDGSGSAVVGGNGGLSASTVQTLGGGQAPAAALAPAPKMECPLAGTGWPKTLQVLVEGVKNVASQKPGARIWFLRRIPRDPMNADSGLTAEQTWGKRSSASPADDPSEGEDVFDVYSLSTANDITGQPYRDW